MKLGDSNMNNSDMEDGELTDDGKNVEKNENIRKLPPRPPLHQIRFENRSAR